MRYLYARKEVTMKAVKTKSGKWQCRPVDHYEYDADGKRRVVLACITRDSKAECLQAGYDYQKDHKKREVSPLTFSGALEKYIQLREPVLSPSTVKAYKSVQRTAFSSLDDIPLQDITSEILQAWISKYSADHSSKSVSNANGLVASVMKMFRPDARFDVRLPQKTVPALYTPTDQDVKQLLTAVSGTDLERAVLLASLGTLRRGEVCALTFDDISGSVVSVNKSMVRTPDEKWIIKPPKTTQSVRSVEYPPEAIKIIIKDRKKGERIVSMSPDAITKEFQKKRKAAGLPYFRFHDLRAYSASIRHALGIPDQYIMQAGGWKTDTVLKQIYRRTMADKSEEFTAVANSHFSDLLSGKKSKNASRKGKKSLQQKL